VGELVNQTRAQYRTAGRPRAEFTHWLARLAWECRVTVSTLRNWASWAPQPDPIEAYERHLWVDREGKHWRRDPWLRSGQYRARQVALEAWQKDRKIAKTSPDEKTSNVNKANSRSAECIMIDLANAFVVRFAQNYLSQGDKSRMPTDARELLTVTQAAEALDKSVATIRRWVQSRHLAHYRIGGEIRIAPADIAALIAAGRRLPVAV
jgi:excisionase family DNA binding protein